MGIVPKVIMEEQGIDKTEEDRNQVMKARTQEKEDLNSV
jgi:hypothetical protein